MKSLPTLLTTENLDQILATFTSNPIPNMEVNRHDDSATVYVTRRKTGKREQLLSAIKIDGKQWRVMAVEGLLSPK